ncbi:MAG: PDDEXK family nuclease [Ktedonobacteraceae bacterium]
MALMVALVGGQSLPNLLPARHSHPEAILFVYSNFTKPIFEKLKDVLRQETTVYGLETDAYNILTIEQALLQELNTDPLASHSLEFNLTGGTKAMSLAAYRVAEQRQAPIIYLESESKRSYVYRYIWEDQRFSTSENALIKECVTLKDFFDLCFGLNKWEKSSSQDNDGGHFETAIANALHLPEYEVITNVRALKDLEIDIAIRCGNQFGIIEAKVGDGGRNMEGIKQLNNAFRQLSTYTQTFYVITVKPSNSQKEIAEASRVRFVELKEYERGSDILSVTDTEKLIGAVAKELKG